MSLTLYRVSAFPKDSLGGNEAGVVLDAKGLTDQEMLNIAKRVNYSETAFLLPGKKADFRLRYFSPTVEVPLCGHATIATFNLMRNLEMVEQKEYTIETNEGILKVRIEENTVHLQLAKPKYFEEINPSEITNALGISKNILLPTPIQVVSTGIKEIFMGVKTLESLNALVLDTDKIIALCDKYDAYGLYIFTLETKHNSDAHGRNFIPPIGIIEESATGTASGALACYLDKYLDKKQTHFVFEQGYSLFKPSSIEVKLTKENDRITDVYVGGRMRFIDKIVGFNPNN
jgi:PhzF family phenazine biosynthesis protein